MFRPLPPLICGAYCAVFDESVWVARPTPGTVAARFANWRPFSGNPSMRARSTTWLTADERGETSGTAADTVTVSAGPASCIAMFTLASSPTLSVMAGVVNRRMPANSATTR